MARQDYMPTEEAAKAVLFNNFANNIGAYTVSLGLAPALVASQAADAAWFDYILQQTTVMRDAAAQWVNYKNTLLNGPGPAAAPLVPVLPGTIPESVEPGVIPRFRDLVRIIKATPAYDESIGEALGIVGPESGEPDPATLAPGLSLRTTGGQVEVIWKKGGMEAVEIQKDSGSGWQFLAIDTRPNYTDTTPFPTPPAMWKYRAIFTKDSQRMGQWSNVAEISVGG